MPPSAAAARISNGVSAGGASILRRRFMDPRSAATAVAAAGEALVVVRGEVQLDPTATNEQASINGRAEVIDQPIIAYYINSMCSNWPKSINRFNCPLILRLHRGWFCVGPSVDSECPSWIAGVNESAPLTDDLHEFIH